MRQLCVVRNREKQTNKQTFDDKFYVIFQTATIFFAAVYCLSDVFMACLFFFKNLILVLATIGS